MRQGLWQRDCSKAKEKALPIEGFEKYVKKIRLFRPEGEGDRSRIGAGRVVADAARNGEMDLCGRRSQLSELGGGRNRTFRIVVLSIPHLYRRARSQDKRVGMTLFSVLLSCFRRFPESPGSGVGGIFEVGDMMVVHLGQLIEVEREG